MKDQIPTASNGFHVLYVYVCAISPDLTTFEHSLITFGLTTMSINIIRATITA